MELEKRRNISIPLSVSLDRLIPFDQQLLELRAEGLPYSTIAAIMGRNKSMLASRVLALARLPATEEEAEARRKERANKMSFRSIPKSLSKMSDLDRKIVRMYCDGMSVTAIADSVDCHRKTISDRLRKMRALGREVVPHQQDAEDAEDADVGLLLTTSAPLPAEIPCIRCRRTFKSFDRMRNRICRKCKSAIAEIHDAPEAHVLA